MSAVTARLINIAGLCLGVLPATVCPQAKCAPTTNVAALSAGGVSDVTRAPKVGAFSAASIEFHYNSEVYLGVIQGLDDVGNAIASYRLEKKKALGGNSSDSLVVCDHDVLKCAAIQSQLLPYWREGGDIQILDPTNIVTTRESGGWTVYESYPLCGWTLPDGVYSPYGGQCYVAVLAAPGTTVSVQITVAKAKACRDIPACWPKDVALIRKMVASIRLKGSRRLPL